MGKVYIARGGELYKFGNSENPEERIKQLQTGSPVPLSIVYTFEARTPKKAEAELKRMFAAKHAHGEWFKLTEADVLSVKQATTDIPAPTPDVPQQPAGAATGALAAVHDIWAYRYYLIVFFIVAVPFFLWMEIRDEPWGNLETMMARQTVFAPPPAADRQPTSLPVGAPAVVQPPPLQGNAQPVSNPPVPPANQGEVLSELIPIPTEQWELPTPQHEATAAIVPATATPTPPVFELTWPQQPNHPDDIAKFAQVAQTTLANAGYTASEKPTFEISQNWVGN